MQTVTLERIENIFNQASPECIAKTLRIIEPENELSEVLGAISNDDNEFADVAFVEACYSLFSMPQLKADAILFLSEIIREEHESA